VVLAAATAQELAAALSWAEGLHGLDGLAQGEPVPARIAGRDWTLLVTGVGPLNAVLHLGLLLGSRPSGPKGVDGVVNLGIAGSFDLDRLPLGGVAVVKRETWPEYGRLGLSPDPAWTRCAALSVAGVTAEPALAERLHARYGALLENMEGFGLAYGCGLRDLPFLEVRVVSNRVGSRRPEDWRLAEALAGLGHAARRLLLGAG
jgi:futalosine hydrolase